MNPKPSIIKAFPRIKASEGAPPLIICALCAMAPALVPAITNPGSVEMRSLRMDKNSVSRKISLKRV